MVRHPRDEKHDRQSHEHARQPLPAQPRRRVTERRRAVKTVGRDGAYDERVGDADDGRRDEVLDDQNDDAEEQG